MDLTIIPGVFLHYKLFIIMKVMINNNIFKVKLCATTSSISEGMTKKRFNENFNGMLFMMPESTEQSFWMYNCIIPLDIIIIDNGNISEIHNNCPPCYDKEKL